MVATNLRTSDACESGSFTGLVMRFVGRGNRPVAALMLFVIANALNLNAYSQAGGAVTINKFRDIPTAEKWCAPEECDWWSRLREAGNELQRRGDDKLRKKFRLLLAEGVGKEFRVPLMDRPAQVLQFGMPRHSDVVRREKVDGVVILTVEFKADGSVGDVSILEGKLGFGLDESAARAARGDIFLPAVKDGAFVTSYVDNLRYKFSYKRDNTGRFN